MCSRTSLVHAVATLLLPALAHAAPWPQWRGPAGTGVSQETNLVFTWSATNHVLWKTPLPGRGHSSPVVHGNRLFLTAEIEGDPIPDAKAPIHLISGEPFRHPESMGADRRHTLKVLALDPSSGRLIWEQTVHDGRVYDDRHRKGAYASPTPATDGQRVVSYFGAEGLFCHDRDGKLLWKANLGPVSTLGMGPGTSPVLHSNLVILQCDQKEGDGSFIQAWDLATGRSVWRTERHISVSWSTPLIVQAPNQPILLTSGTENLIAYNPVTGAELWTAPGLTNNAIPSPIAWLDTALSTTGYPKKRVIASHAPTGRVLWEYDRGTAYVPSPAPWDGKFYLMTDSGQLSCLDAATGKVHYDSERLPAPAKFTASAVTAANRILLTAEDGRTFVIRAGPQYRVESVNPIDEPVLASLAIADGRIFIRGDRNLFAVGSPETISP